MSELLDLILFHEEAFKSKARLASLYSDFAILRTANPDGYIANSAAWRSALEKASRAGLTSGNTPDASSPLLLRTGPALVKQLERQDVGRPLALGAVVVRASPFHLHLTILRETHFSSSRKTMIERFMLMQRRTQNDAVATGSLIPLRDFMSATHSIYTKSWMSIPLPSLSGVARWILGQIGISGSSKGELIQGEFVVIRNLEEIANAIVNHVATTSTTPSSLVYSPTTFAEEFAHLMPSASQASLTPASTTLQILVRHLSRDRAALSLHITPNGAMTIKFASPGSSQPPAPITQQDETIANLHTLIHSLTAQTSALNDRIITLDKEARTALASNNRTRALNALRSKKAAEALSKKREDSLAQVTGVLSAIDEAAGQVEMVGAMEQSAKVLKELNKQIGSVERVERVTDELREEMDVVGLTSGALAEPGKEAVDEDELDEELKALENEGKGAEDEKAAKQAEQELGSLPSVPVGAVGEVWKATESDKERTRQGEGQQSEFVEHDAGDAELSNSLDDLSLEKPREPAAEA